MKGKIGIKQADGKITPVLECEKNNTAALRITPAGSDQKKAHIEIFHLRKPDEQKPKRVQLINLVKLPSVKNQGGGLLRLALKAVKRNLFQAVFSVRPDGPEESFTFKLKKVHPFGLALIVIYGIVVIGLLAFLVTQTFPELSLQKLFGISL